MCIVKNFRIFFHLHHDDEVNKVMEAFYFGIHKLIIDVEYR